MKRKLQTILFILAGFPSFLLADEVASPTKIETAEWLSTNVDGNKFMMLDPAAGVFINQRYTLIVPENNTCKGILFVKTKTTFGQKNSSHKSLTSIDLGDISINGIKTTPIEGSLEGKCWLEVASSKHKFQTLTESEETATEPKSEKSERDKSFQIPFDDAALCERAAKAFSHIAKLCGAKPDPF